ncbi:hypothetical protein [Campylobacter vicugnae]|uniref:hypothetical protein n=1 Tax=Campylobacter vicugnae TaxID=1660076 RepID=UPI00112F8F3D|nr:hypothetical protein [Campylobacter sp. RM8835]
MSGIIILRGCRLYVVLLSLLLLLPCCHFATLATHCSIIFNATLPFLLLIALLFYYFNAISLLLLLLPLRYGHHAVLNRYANSNLA